VQLPAVIKYLLVDGIRSVIGGHLCQLNAKFRQICAGHVVLGTLPSTTTASGGCRNCSMSGQALELNGWGLPVQNTKPILTAFARRVLVSLPPRAIFRLVFSV
jgi:hypothetical protein